MPLFSNKLGIKPALVFFAADIRGSEVSFRKFDNAGKSYEAGVADKLFARRDRPNFGRQD